MLSLCSVPAQMGHWLCAALMFSASSSHLWSVMVRASPGFTHLLSLGIDSWALSMLQNLPLAQTEGTAPPVSPPLPHSDPLLHSFESLQSLRDANAFFIPCVLFCPFSQLIELAHRRGRESTAGSRQKRSEIFPPHDLLFSLLLQQHNFCLWAQLQHS